MGFGIVAHDGLALGLGLLLLEAATGATEVLAAAPVGISAARGGA